MHDLIPHKKTNAKLFEFQWFPIKNQREAQVHFLVACTGINVMGLLFSINLTALNRNLFPLLYLECIDLQRNWTNQSLMRATS